VGTLVSSMKWMGFLFCLLLGCDGGLLSVRVWWEGVLGCVLEQPGSCLFILSASELCVLFSLWRLFAEQEIGSVGVAKPVRLTRPILWECKP
jgi:hypothetical protein